MPKFLTDAGAFFIDSDGRENGIPDSLYVRNSRGVWRIQVDDNGVLRTTSVRGYSGSMIATIELLSMFGQFATGGLPLVMPISTTHDAVSFITMLNVFDVDKSASLSRTLVDPPSNTGSYFLSASQWETPTPPSSIDHFAITVSSGNGGDHFTGSLLAWAIDGTPLSYQGPNVFSGTIPGAPYRVIVTPSNGSFISGSLQAWNVTAQTSMTFAAQSSSIASGQVWADIVSSPYSATIIFSPADSGSKYLIGLITDFAY